MIRRKVVNKLSAPQSRLKNKILLKSDARLISPDFTPTQNLIKTYFEIGRSYGAYFIDADYCYTQQVLIRLWATP
ncbi:hypothetical protein SAMN05443543_10433 [Flavobacterium flevense]|nr:hypothetical protein [Flavobacterium flevense]SHL70905.1 hypothetical protein SAMN05443543_10433 [Flavobacterium flevense]